MDRLCEVERADLADADSDQPEIRCVQVELRGNDWTVHLDGGEPTSLEPVDPTSDATCLVCNADYCDCDEATQVAALTEAEREAIAAAHEQAIEAELDAARYEEDLSWSHRPGML